MSSEIIRLAFESIIDSYIFYNGDCSCDAYSSCKFCNFTSELEEKLSAPDRYIAKLESQISRDRESLIKANENEGTGKRYLPEQREWIND